jgi:hypothetical protein
MGVGINPDKPRYKLQDMPEGRMEVARWLVISIRQMAVRDLAGA